jgi:hypothetical protein
MLLAINLQYVQTGKNSRMYIKVQVRLMQARFVEIHQFVLQNEGRILF